MTFCFIFCAKKIVTSCGTVGRSVASASVGRSRLAYYHSLLTLITYRDVKIVLELVVLGGDIRYRSFGDRPLGAVCLSTLVASLCTYEVPTVSKLASERDNVRTTQFSQFAVWRSKRSTHATQLILT